MSYFVCKNCGFSTDDASVPDCPNCGGYLSEKEEDSIVYGDMRSTEDLYH